MKSTEFRVKLSPAILNLYREILSGVFASDGDVFSNMRGGVGALVETPWKPCNVSSVVCVCVRRCTCDLCIRVYPENRAWMGGIEFS